MVVALEWVSTITTVSVAMVGPGLLGIWLDRHFGTRAIFGLLGFAIGLPYGIWYLVRLTSTKRKRDDLSDRSPPT